MDLVPKKRKKSLEEGSDAQNIVISSPISTHNRFQILQRPKKATIPHSIHKETEATFNTGKCLEVNLLVTDEIILRQMIEAEFSRWLSKF